MPGEGKSGNCLRDCFKRVLRRGSSVAVEEGAESLIGGSVVVASGADGGGWADVEEFDMMKRGGRKRG